MTRQLTYELEALEQEGLIETSEDGRPALTLKGIELLNVLLAVRIAKAADCNVHHLMRNAEQLTRLFMSNGSML